MKKRRHTPEQITKKLREADRLLAEGKTITVGPTQIITPTRVSLAKPIRRIPGWPPPGRTAEPGALFHLAGGAGARKRLAD